MKYKLRTETTDIPAECFKATREDFIAKWSKKLYQKSPQDVREQFLGEIWDMENKATKQAVPPHPTTELESELQESTEELLKTLNIKRKGNKKNGVPGDTTQSPTV